MTGPDQQLQVAWRGMTYDSHERNPNAEDKSAGIWRLPANAYLRRRVMLMDPKSDW